MDLPAAVEEHTDGVRVALKVVPGGARDQILGPHGDRLRVKVAAPPEGGKANRAVCALLAARLRIPVRDVEVVQGMSSPRKTVRLRGVAAEAVALALFGPQA